MVASTRHYFDQQDAVQTRAAAQRWPLLGRWGTRRTRPMTCFAPAANAATPLEWGFNQ